MLESGIDGLNGLLLGIESDDVQNIIAAATDSKSKITMARGLIIFRSFEKTWVKRAIKILDRVDNELRVKRNSLVHSSFVAPTGKMIKKTAKTRIQKPQAYQLTVSTIDMVHIKPSEILKISEDFAKTFADIIFLMAYVQYWQETPQDKKKASYEQYMKIRNAIPLRKVNKKSAIQTKQKRL